MTFEEWFDEEGGYDGGFDTYQSAAEAAWDYQQQRIVDLVKQLGTAYDHGYANGYTDGKQDAQEEE